MLTGGMMGREFEYQAEIDEQGVVLYRFSGIFDVAEWVVWQRETHQRLFGDSFDPLRPVVVDLRSFKTSFGAWRSVADLVCDNLDLLGETKARCALVTGGSLEPEFACRFYLTYKQVMRGADCSNYRTFASYDAGYAWAVEDAPRRPALVEAGQGVNCA